MIDDSSPWRLPRADAGVLAAGSRFLPRTIAWMALLFAAVIAAMFASIRLPDWWARLADDEMACALVVPAATLLVYALVVRVVERRPAGELSLSRAPAELAAGALVGFVFIATTLCLLWACGLYRVQAGTWRHGWHYFVYNAYISALLEELAFRGVLLRLLARLLGLVPGWLLSSALFALAHAGHASPVAMVEILIEGGLLFGALFLVSGRLWLSIGAHLAYDFTEWSLMGVGDPDGWLVVAPAPGHPDWLTGGAFGPDGSVFGPVVGVLLIALILDVSRRRATRASPDQRPA